MSIKTKNTATETGEYQVADDSGDEVTIVTRDLYATASRVESAAEEAAEYFDSVGDYSRDRVLVVTAWTGEKYDVSVTSETVREYSAQIQAANDSEDE
jgi:putative methionine-R-sulfoxide reductase with GAF domain